MNDFKENTKKIEDHVELRPWKKEAMNCIEKWGETGILGGIEDFDRLKNVALLLENQRLMNGMSISNNAQFNKLSIHLVREIYTNVFMDKFIHLEAMLGPASLIKNNTLTAKTKIFKKRWGHNYDTVNFSNKEKCGDIALAISNEINKEIINDLSDNCSVVGSKGKKSLDDKIEEIAKEVLKKSKTMPDWIICSKGVKNKIKKEHYMEIYETNLIKNMLIMGPDKKHKIIYIYAPYIPLSLYSTKNEQLFSILTRYDKKLVQDGAKYLGKIIIND